MCRGTITASGCSRRVGTLGNFVSRLFDGSFPVVFSATVGLGSKASLQMGAWGGAQKVKDFKGHEDSFGFVL